MNKRNSSKNVYNNSNNNRYKHQQTPSTSHDEASPSTSQKFTIEQKLPTNKKEPNNVKRTFDPNKEIVIPRRFGEGIKPIFNREDVQVNSYLQSNNSRRSVSINSPKRSERKRSSSSSCSSSSSPQRYRPKNRRHEKSLSPKRKKTPDKVPYFVDTKREQDRLKSKIDVSHNKSEHKHTTTTSESRKRTTRTRSRSRSYERRRRRSSSREKYRSRSHSRHRHSRQSRSRSHSRDRYYRSSRIPVETQYIPVPVPMEYSPFAPRWIQPMLPYPYPRYPVMRPPPNFPIPPFFPPRMRGQRFPRPQRERTYQTRHQ